MLILFVSALLSGVVDNIPYTAAMSPIVHQLTEGIADPVQADALWWSLAIGADFGGNLTAIGASANVVVLGIAKRSGSPISFWEFTKKGAIVTVVTICSPPHTSGSATSCSPAEPSQSNQSSRSAPAAGWQWRRDPLPADRHRRYTRNRSAGKPGRLSCRP